MKHSDIETGGRGYKKSAVQRTKFMQMMNVGNNVTDNVTDNVTYNVASNVASSTD